jgi:hypothetical protein
MPAKLMGARVLSMVEIVRTLLRAMVQFTQEPNKSVSILEWRTLIHRAMEHTTVPPVLLAKLMMKSRPARFKAAIVFSTTVLAGG